MNRKLSKPIKYLLFLSAFVFLLLIAFVFFYFRFSGDWGVNLPGGYSLSSIYGGAVEILDSNKNVVIFPNIETYKVYKDKQLITGYVSNADLPPTDSANSIPGYFILNTKNGTIRQGLSEKVWLDSLRGYGITEKPRLHEPTGFDRDYK